MAAQVDRHRVAGLDRGAAGQHLGQAAQALLGHPVDLRHPGLDVGQVGLGRRPQRVALGALALLRRGRPRPRPRKCHRQRQQHRTGPGRAARQRLVEQAA